MSYRERFWWVVPTVSFALVAGVGAAVPMSPWLLGGICLALIWTGGAIEWLILRTRRQRAAPPTDAPPADEVSTR